MGGAHTAEAPALHSALEALALGLAGDVDILAEGRSAKRRLVEPTSSSASYGDAELGDFHLQRNFGLGEVFALAALATFFCLASPSTELESDVTVTLSGANRNHLAIF